MWRLPTALRRKALSLFESPSALPWLPQWGWAKRRPPGGVASCLREEDTKVLSEPLATATGYPGGGYICAQLSTSPRKTGTPGRVAHHPRAVSAVV